MLLRILKGVASIPIQAVAAATETLSSCDPGRFAMQFLTDLCRMVAPGGAAGAAREEGQEANKASSYIDANGRYVRK